MTELTEERPRVGQSDLEGYACPCCARPYETTPAARLTAEDSKAIDAGADALIHLCRRDPLGNPVAYHDKIALKHAARLRALAQEGGAR